MQSKIRLFKVQTYVESVVEALRKTLNSGYIGQGPRVEEFEGMLAELFGYRKIFATNSGTAALDLAYALIGLGPGDEVVSTAMTCCATNTPLVNRGVRIVWADVDRNTGLIDPKDALRKLTPKTKAIVACDWGGKLCDYNALSTPGIPLVQDGAHSILAFRKDFSGGVSFGGRCEGDYRMWSFQSIKHFTTGDGGALRVPEHQEERCELLRWYGLDRRKGASFRCDQDIDEAGYKYGMNDIAATIGIVNMSEVKTTVKYHRENAKFYCDTFKDLKQIQPPEWDPGSSWWLYTLLVNDRKAFLAHMESRDIEASPVHSRNDTKKAMRFWSGDLPGLDFFAEHEVCIPVGWWLEGDERDRVVDAVIEFDKKG